MALTTGAVVAGASGSVLSGLVSGALQVIKIVASVALAVVFAAAIFSICGMIQAFVATSIISEVFAIISMCLPFNAVAVFSSIFLVLTALVAFIVARKVYLLSTNLISVSGH